MRYAFHMSKNDLKVGSLYSEEYSVKMLDGSGESLHYLRNRRYIGGGNNFANIDGSIAHLTDTQIATLTHSRMTDEDFDRAVANNGVE